MATKQQKLENFQERLTRWIVHTEEDMQDFLCGYHDSPFRLASALSMLNNIANHNAKFLAEVDATLRERLDNIQIKASLLEASGYDLEEEMPF